MVSGYGSPGMGAKITYPADFQNSIQNKIPDYESFYRLKHDLIGDDAAFSDAIDTTRHSFKNSYKTYD